MKRKRKPKVKKGETPGVYTTECLLCKHSLVYQYTPSSHGQKEYWGSVHNSSRSPGYSTCFGAHVRICGRCENGFKRKNIKLLMSAAQRAFNRWEKKALADPNGPLAGKVEFKNTIFKPLSYGKPPPTTQHREVVTPHDIRQVIPIPLTPGGKPKYQPY